MLKKQVALIDDRGFYLEPEIVAIAETLDEAKALNYPIIKRLEQNKAPENLEEPEQLKQMRSQLEVLRSMPQSEEIDQAIASTEAKIAPMIAMFEKMRTANEWVEIEEFQVPPLRSNQIEKPIPDGFWHPKWDGFDWIEGLSAAEIDARKPKLPNWVGFVADWIASDLDEALATTSSISWLIRFNQALDKAPNVNISSFVDAFNRCVDGMPAAFSASQVKELRAIVKTNLIPVEVGKGGKLAVEE